MKIKVAIEIKTIRSSALKLLFFRAQIIISLLRYTELDKRKVIRMFYEPDTQNHREKVGTIIYL